MPQDLESIVQKMIDAGESEENIAGVIKEYNKKPPPEYKGPDTFWGGVKQSITSGEAPIAGLKGGLGWAKGATIDIPQSFLGALQSVGNLIANPIDTISSIPSSISSGIQNIGEMTARAGSNPEEFGRMVGGMTGQPLVTAGLAKGAPIIKPYAVKGLQKTGQVMQDYQPISGMIPRVAEMRTMRNVERALGSKLSNIGAEKPKIKPTSKEVIRERDIPSLTREIVNDDTLIIPNQSPLPPGGMTKFEFDNLIRQPKLFDISTAPTSQSILKWIK